MKFEETTIDKFWNQLRSEVKDANDRIDILVGVIALEFEFLSEHEPDSYEALDYITKRYKDRCNRIKMIRK